MSKFKKGDLVERIMSNATGLGIPREGDLGIVTHSVNKHKYEQKLTIYWMRCRASYEYDLPVHRGLLRKVSHDQV